MSAPNGSAPEATGKKMSTVVGINFCNTYASISVITKVRIFPLVLNKIAHLKIPSLKEGLADCIANEDGERQIACAISFQGEELVSNSQLPHYLFLIFLCTVHRKPSKTTAR